jgi:hypothetical protein
LDSGEIFFSLKPFILAPKKRITKFQAEMTTSIEDLKASMEAMTKQFAGLQDMAKQFAGFQDAMATTLDKLNDLEAWWTVAETSMGSMMQKSTEAVNRIQQLETRPPPPALPPPMPAASPERTAASPERTASLRHGAASTRRADPLQPSAVSTGRTDLCSASLRSAAGWVRLEHHPRALGVELAIAPRAWPA